MNTASAMRTLLGYWSSQRLRFLFLLGVFNILSGCFLTVEPVFTEKNSIEPKASPTFQNFLEAARQVAEDPEENEIYVNVPLGNPAIDLMVVSIPETGLVVVQEFVEEVGECATTGCYIYYGVRISDDGRPERCDIRLGFLETESNEKPITQAATRHNVELTALVDNRRVRGYTVSGSHEGIYAFIIEQFEKGPFDCSMQAISGGSGYERWRRN